MMNPPITGISELDAYLYNLHVNGYDNTNSGYSSDIATGQIKDSKGNVVGYLYEFIHVKYADDNIGTGLSDTQTGKYYYGINNSTSSTESTNPADYTWYFVTSGFGTLKTLYYRILGGRQIKFDVNNNPIDYHWLPAPTTAIDLDIIVPPQSITGSEILNATLSANKLNVAALDQSTGALVTNAVSAETIAANAVTELKLATGAVTGTKIAAETITGNNIAALTIGAGQIAASAITTVKLAAGAVTANLISSGEIQAGTTITVGGTGTLAPVVINSNGEIISNNSSTGDKARLFYGNVEIYKNVPSVGSVLYKALSRAEFGSATNNTIVTIPGYFKTQPKVLVSPADLKLYDNTYSSQSQSIQCSANSITETSSGSMVWRFTPVATLSLAANTGQVVTNESSGSISGSFTSISRTTPANATSVTLNATLQSYRSTGAGGNFYYRTVRWKGQYFSGGVWVDTATTATNLGANASGSSTTSITITFPSAGTWTFRMFAEAVDTGGTFSAGTVYEYLDDNVSRTGTVSAIAQIYTGSPNPSTATLNYSPTYTVPTGWEVTSSNYTYNYAYNLFKTGSGITTITGSGLDLSANTGGYTTTASKTYVGTTSALTFSLYATVVGGISNGQAYAELQVYSMSGTVTRRRPVPTSTTAVNNFQLNYYNYSLTSSQVLATGTLNWIALGD